MVQEAHRRLFDYKIKKKVRDVDSLLRRIVINLSITYYHRQLSQPSFERVDALDRRGLLVDAAPGPEHTVEAARQLDAAVSLLNAMTPRTCQMFVCHRWGYSYEEIAFTFGVKPRTVEKHIAIASSFLLAGWMP